MKKCKFHHVFPKFIELGFKCSVKNRRTSEVLQTAKQKWLNLEIKNCHRKLNQIELETYALHLRLSNEYDADKWTEFDLKVQNVIAHKLKDKTDRQERKLKHLLSFSHRINMQTSIPPPEETINQRPGENTNLVINLSSETFTEDEMTYLNNGLGFCRRS
jgi:hypothetical protein